MKKNTKKKFRDIRNAVVMMCVMVAMMSTASYAWFSLTDSPTVTGMKMTAASSSGGLTVSNEESANFYQAINVTSSDVKILKPVTPDTSKSEAAFQEGVYTGNVVTGLSTVTDIENYVAKYTYYLKSDADPSNTEQIDIGLVMGNSTLNGDKEMKADDSHTPTIAGSMVRRAKDAEGGSEYAAYAVRVGFVVTAVKDRSALTQKMIIWDPNTEKVASENANNPQGLTFAENNSGVEDNLGDIEDICSETTGKVTTGGKDLTTDKLFSMYKGSTAKIDMYIWLEGTDDFCVDQIQADDIEAQVQFIVVGDGTGTINNTP